MHTPYFVSIGHITHNIHDTGRNPGGPALYAAATAKKLGLHAGIVTSFHPPFPDPALLERIDVCSQESVNTTTVIRKSAGTEWLSVPEVADAIEPRLVLKTWRKAHIVVLCPVAHEFQGTEFVPLFPNSMLGICPQGWMYTRQRDGRLSSCDWDDYQFVLPYATAVFLHEDAGSNRESLATRYSKHAKIMVLTRANGETSIYHNDGVHHLRTFESNASAPVEITPVFAAAFLANYAETHDPLEAGTFAHCTASFLLHGTGVAAIPSLLEVQARLKDDPSGC